MTEKSTFGRPKGSSSDNYYEVPASSLGHSRRVISIHHDAHLRQKTSTWLVKFIRKNFFEIALILLLILMILELSTLLIFLLFHFNQDEEFRRKINDYLRNNVTNSVQVWYVDVEGRSSTGAPPL